MYEKLDKLRADLKRVKEKKAEIEAKIKSLEMRLKEAEESQILADVKQMNLTPEQLAKFLQLATSGQLPMPGKEEFGIPLNEEGGRVDTDEPEEENDDEEYPF